MEDDNNKDTLFYYYESFRNIQNHSSICQNLHVFSQLLLTVVYNDICSIWSKWKGAL